MNRHLDCFKTKEGQLGYFAAYDAALKLWPIAYEESYVTTSYGQTHMISCGAKDAGPLILLHGGYASSTMWFPNIADLAKKFRVLTFDTIGEPGKSVPTKKNNTQSDLAAWLVGVLDELKIQQTKVVGLSRGGWLALNLAIYAPLRLEKIVLLSPAASFIRLNKFFSAIAGSVMRIPTRTVSKIALHSWVTSGFKVNDLFAEQFITGLQSWNWAMATHGYSGVMPFVFPVDELRKIKLPVQMLIGDHDKLNPLSVLRQARQMIPHIQTEIIPNAGHFLSMEQPELVDARILEFLTA